MAGASGHQRDPSRTEDGMYGRAETFHQPQPGRYSQPAYPSASLGELENRTEAFQKEASNEIHDQSDLLAHRTGPGEPGLVGLATSRKHDNFRDVAGSGAPFLAGNGSQTYQYHPSTTQDVRPVQDESLLSEFSARRAAYPPTPLPDRTFMYRSPLMEGQHDASFPPTTRQQGTQRSTSHSYRDQFASYSPYAPTLTPTPDRSTIGSPMLRPSPDSLRRELEATKEYSERVLTKLMETEQLLQDRDRMLAATLDDLARAQRQAEMYSQECTRLRDRQNPTRQQAQPAVNSGQLEEAQKVTDFYRQKADQLSRENMNISRQNRKLTEDLAIAQRSGS